ncbi:MAG: exodeoxyribonuclease VII small subunit [Firmicutes bacterium]|nr:exodeoxyribonuclease VII small subunit [Bacillota bacterium]
MVDKEISFEEALKNLEEVVRQLEQGDLTLEEALNCFQSGINLVRVCSQKLQAAENQVEILMQQDSEGSSQGGEG